MERIRPENRLKIGEKVKLNFPIANEYRDGVAPTWKVYDYERDEIYSVDLLYYSGAHPKSINQEDERGREFSYVRVEGKLLGLTHFCFEKVN